MSAVTWMLIPVGFAVLLAVVVLSAVLVLPVVSEVSERIRIQREAQEAAWRIHQHATRAFGEMLAAARRAEAREES